MPNMREQDFRDIIDRYLQGKATPGEIKAVDSFFDRYRKEGKDWPHDVMGDPDEAEKIISSHILEKQRSERKSFWLNTAWKVAATLLVLMSVGYGAYIFTLREPVAEQAEVTLPAGGNKAILLLADGTEVELDSGISKSISLQGNVAVVNEDGKLSYEVYKPDDKISFNTLRTPRGGQYQIVLGDGSKVWLNSVSSLRYPIAFTGKERVVELTGEAYFEIARNEQMPFKVKVNTPVGGAGPAEILVLGTHFNVMAYPDEGTVATTLIEGSVQITKGNEKGTLKPGEQGQITRNGTVAITNGYDVNQAIAWKNGNFVFNDTALEGIMRQVSRWYDVDVTFQDDVQSLQFGGVVSRKENASAVLTLLELTGEVDFDVKGRDIVVKSGDK